MPARKTTPAMLMPVQNEARPVPTIGRVGFSLDAMLSRGSREMTMSGALLLRGVTESLNVERLDGRRLYVMHCRDVYRFLDGFTGGATAGSPSGVT